MTAPSPGARFTGAVLNGRYRLGKMIGEGGMGSVYQAEAAGAPGQAPSRVAVKILHEEMAANPIVVERFLAEGDVCRRLDHPGILRVFDVGHQSGVPYLVMELLEGRALIEYTQHQQRLPVNFAITVCAGVLNALDYAHSRGVIHRDLKPENVFLVPTSASGYQVKLLDFGIAKSIDAAGGAKRRTATGVLLGTPGYMSPEQVKGAAKVDHRTDLWAVGVMFYEMVAGAIAFPADGEDPSNVWGLISAVLTKDPVPLSVYDRQLAPFDAFIARALAKNLDRRHVDARSMAEDLLRIGRGEQQQAVQATVLAPAGGPFLSEQRAVPINSRGELTAIPSVHPSSSVGIGTTVPSGSAGAPAAMAATHYAQGGEQGGGAAAVAATAYAPAPTPRFPVQVAQPEYAATAYALAQPGANAVGMAQTAYAPDARASAPAPVNNLRAAQVSGTAPSGFAPPPTAKPTAAPYIPPNAAADAGGGDARGEREGGSGIVTWVLIGVVLIVALVAAVFWVAH